MKYIICILPIMMMLFLVSCVNYNVVDEPHDSQIPISFEISASQETRAAQSFGLEEYVHSFKVYGLNGNTMNGSWKTEYKVFDNYEVNWIGNSASATESNTNGWEYVGYGNQFIKYWDYGQESHYFWAVADKDKGSFSVTQGNATFKDGTDGRVATFKCNLTSANTTDANALYYSKICKVEKAKYGQPVKLEFIPYLSKVRIGFYETVPGYVVNNLKVGDGTDIVVNSNFVSGGTCTLTYDYDSSKISTSSTSQTFDNSMNFGVVQYQTLTPRAEGTDEDDLTSTNATGTYLARSSENASFAQGGGADKNYYVNMLPYENRNTPIKFTCNYTLIDPTSGSTNQVTDAVVTIPAEYAKWEPGYEYTYIFKISSVASTEFDLDVYVKSWINQYVNHPLHNW